MKTSLYFLLILGSLLSLSSCHDFVFGHIEVDDSDNPLQQKQTPRTGADYYYGTDPEQHPLPLAKGATLHNPDPQGALANWYTCLVMFKEGHSHHGGKLHGNPVYTRGAWRQEQFLEIRNTASGKPEIHLDPSTSRTFIEAQRDIPAPPYVRLIGGPALLWGCCLYFYNNEGKLLNDSILQHSDEYQIFYSISDKDNEGNPFPLRDVRYQLTMPDSGRIAGVESPTFAGKSFAELQELTPKVFQYTYRDTWTHSDMGDGVRNYYNQRLLPPFKRKDYHDAKPADIDAVGLKGHFLFDFDDYSNALEEKEWPLKLSKQGIFSNIYKRPTFLLPQFYLAVRVMKCNKGKKAIIASSEAKGGKQCAPFNAPDERSGWQELVRFNIPLKVVASRFDSDPTQIDPFEPYYYHIGREILLSPQDAFELIRSMGDERGLGYDAWFL